MEKPTLKDWPWEIRPAGNFPDLKLSELWRYKDLLFRFVKRDLIVNYRQTILGPLWVLLEPLVATLVYFTIFTSIMKIPVGETPPLLFYLSGIILWIYFQDTVNGISATFQQNASLLSKVYFPRIILPFSFVVSKFTRLCIQFILLAAVYLFYVTQGANIHVTVYLLLVPLLLVVFVLFTLGCGLILASLSARYRDVQNLMMFLLRLLMFASPVFYPYSLVSGPLRTVIGLNPLTPLMEAFRFSLFGTGILHTAHLLYGLIATLVVLLLGLFSFGKVEQNVIDTI